MTANEGGCDPRNVQQASQALTFRHEHSAHADEHIARGDATVLQRLVRDHQAPSENCTFPGILEAFHPTSHIIASLRSVQPYSCMMVACKSYARSDHVPSNLSSHAKLTRVLTGGRHLNTALFQGSLKPSILHQDSMHHFAVIEGCWPYSCRMVACNSHA